MSGVFAVVSACRNVTADARRLADSLVHAEYHQVDMVCPGHGVVLGRRTRSAAANTERVASSSSACVHLIFEGLLVEAAGAGSAQSPVSRRERTDADRALAAFLDRGIDGLTRLRGEFLVVVWDGRTRELIVVNDRFGLYPHYYAATGNALVLAPEIKALSRVGGVARTLDLVAFAQYVRYQQLLGDRTWLADVKLLPPGSVLRYRTETRELRTRPYWGWDHVPRQEISLDDAVSEASTRLHRAVNARVRAGERVGVFLSGGLDGRLIVSFLEERERATAMTFGSDGCRDVHYGRRIARRAGMTHHWSQLRGGDWVLEHAPLHLKLTEGLHSWVHMHGIGMLEDARSRIDVNLTGWDGGTTFRGFMVGYDRDARYRQPADEEALTAVLQEGLCQHFTWPGLTDAEADQVTLRVRGGSLSTLATDSLRDEVALTSPIRNDIRPDVFYVLSHVRRLTQYLVVFTRSAVDVRCPYFDYDLIDLIYSLPLTVRATPDLTRRVLTRQMASLARIPNEADLRLPHESALVRNAHSLIPRGAAWLRRYGIPAGVDRSRLYADYEHYLRTDLRHWAEALLFEPRTRDRGLFDPAAVQRLWERHLSGRELWTIGKIAPLMTIEQTIRYLIDDEPAATAAVPASVG